MQAACVTLLLALLDRAYATRPMHFSSRRFRTSTQSADLVQRRVKCESFSVRPSTYCVLLWGRTDNITGADAQKRCQDIGMELLNSATTSAGYLCYLTKVFSLERTRFWWTDRLNKVHLDEFDFDFCYGSRWEQNAGINHTVVCQKLLHYSNGGTAEDTHHGGRCVTFQEGPDYVEYCFFNERVQAVESAAKCAEKSSSLLDASQLQGTEMLEYARNLVRTNLDFWVDVTGSDIEYVSGALKDSSSYAIRCNTVRFGPTDPLFWDEDCSESHPIICEQATSFSDNRSSYVNDTECAYRQSSSGAFNYCIPEGRSFSLSAGREFCKNRGLVLLRESTLRNLHGLYDVSLPEDLRDIDRYRIWEAGFDTKGKTSRGYCTATNLVQMMPETQSLPCYHQLGYICRKRKLPRCFPTNDDQVSFAPGEKTTASLQRMCISPWHLTYEESVEFCNKKNKTLLSERLLSGEEEKLLLKQYKGFSIWVVPRGRGITSFVTPCESGVIQTDADCSQKHRAVCTSDNSNEPTETTEPLRKCYGCQDPTLGNTGVSQAFMEALGGIPWDQYFYSRDSGDWEDYFWPALSNVTDIVRTPDDFEALPYLLGKSFETFNKYVLCQGEEDQKEYNKKFGHIVVDIVENTMLKSKIWKRIDEDRRILTASCLFNIVEDIALQKNLTTSG